MPLPRRPQANLCPPAKTPGDGPNPARCRSRTGKTWPLSFTSSRFVIEVVHNPRGTLPGCFFFLFFFLAIYAPPYQNPAAALRTLLMAAPFPAHNNQGITSFSCISCMDFENHEKTLCPQTNLQETRSATRRHS